MSKDKRRDGRRRMTIVAVLLVWTYIYNLLVKQEGAIGSFFGILDTISDDFLMGSLITLATGTAIVMVFSVTKLYTQIVSDAHSFRILEDVLSEELPRKRIKRMIRRLLHFEREPHPASVLPQRPISLLLSLSFIYIMSWLYVVLFSEALFFVSWSAGVDLPLEDAQTLLLLPTLALSIPFSARVMAYLRYPYTQDYADFIPGALFVLVVVMALGGMFESEDQEFFLVQVWRDPEYLRSFLMNGAFLAFVPVFFESLYWLVQLSVGTDNGKEVRNPAGRAGPRTDTPSADSSRPGSTTPTVRKSQAPSSDPDAQ